MGNIKNIRAIFELKFEEYSEAALEKSWEWLNDPEIKRLTATGDFDRTSQRIWFDNLKSKSDYFIRAVLIDDNVVGICGIKKITSEDGEVWGYIGEKEYWGKAIGLQYLSYLLDYAKSINLKSVYAFVIKTNYMSMRLLERSGFKKEEDVENDSVLLRLYL